MKRAIFSTIVICGTQLFAQDALYNVGSFQMHEGVQIGCFGDFINDNTMAENNGELFLTGNSGIQTFSGTGIFIFDSVIVNNSDHIIIQQEFRISENISFSIGNLMTNRDAIDSQYVHFLDGSNYDGVSDLSFIDGVAAKTGNSAFDFPIGDTDELRYLQISAPDLATDQFKTFYLNVDPDADYPTWSVDLTCLNHVSRCEYWILNRTEGLSAVSVGLNYGTSSCGIDVLCDLLVARWDGTEWKSEGNGGVAGTTSSGTITSGDGCVTCGSPMTVSEFSPFTMGSSTLNNPLPITLIDFEVQQKETSAILLWETASEINNDFYIIERSSDGINWGHFGTVMGAGTVSQISNYELMDRNPLLGTSYYRLSQVDYDGTKKIVGLESVMFSANQLFKIHPNPASLSINIYYNGDSPTNISVYNTGGQLINDVIGEDMGGYVSIDAYGIPPGIYYVHIRNQEALFVKKVVII